MTETHELSITRHIDAAPDAVWRAWTEHASEWFCPRPWTTPLVDWDLRPGGRARVVMRSPEGEETPHDGVFLEIVPGRRIVWTDAFIGDWMPDGPFMVAIAAFEAEGDGTRYTATVRHWTAEAKARHEAMGFEQGWGAVADQLAEVARRL